MFSACQKASDRTPLFANTNIGFGDAAGIRHQPIERHSVDTVQSSNGQQVVCERITPTRRREAMRLTLEGVTCAGPGQDASTLCRLSLRDVAIGCT
jgi:hypothetical protein